MPVENKIFIAILIILLLVLIASFIRILKLKKKVEETRKPDVGEIVEEKYVLVSVSDPVYNSPFASEPSASVGNFIAFQLEGNLQSVAVKYYAISRNGRFLIKVSSQSQSQSLWIEPSNCFDYYELAVSNSKPSSSTAVSKQ